MTIRRLFVVPALASTMAAASLTLSAAPRAQDPTDPIHWTLTAPAAGASSGPAGVKVTVTLTADIDSGWHLYALTPVPDGPIPTRITVPTGQDFSQAGDIIEPAPQTAFDDNFHLPLDFHSDKASFGVPLKAAAGITGDRTAKVAVSYQTCNDRICLPPKEVTVSVSVKVAKAAAQAED